MAAQIRDNQNCSSSQRLQDRKGESHRRQLESDYPKEVDKDNHKGKDSSQLFGKDFVDSNDKGELKEQD